MDGVLYGYLLTVFLIPMSGVLCSEYDPHPFPDHGPFVEGWYMRFIDFSQSRSFALLFGSVEPEDHEVAENLAFVGLLLGEENKKLESIAHFPPKNLFNVTLRGGQPVTQEPDISSPCNFTLYIPTMGHVTVTSNKTDIDLVVDDVHFKASVGAAVPWNPDGLGPAGWVQHFSWLLPLNWFVFSLRSPITNYQWKNLETGKVISGNTGFVHMEKNWGSSFPEAWIWTEAVHQANHKITYALAYGPLDFGPISINGFLFGYRNPHKAISVDMNPTNSWVTSKVIQGCRGHFQIIMTGFWYRVQVDVTGNVSTFTCLYCPEKNGFKKASVETFGANATVVVSKRRFLSFKEVDRQKFQGFAALEFGGAFRCKPCSKQTS